MFGNAFEEFEKDPFFDFGSSPFKYHPFFNPRRAESLPRLMPSDAGSKRHGSDADKTVAVRENPKNRPAFDDALVMPNFGNAFGSMFEGVNRIMQNMGNQMRAMEEASRREDFDGHMYSHSSVYSYSNNGKEEPHVYQAMSETHAGPGGVRETRRAMRDSKSREERMAVGRHIGDRGHLVERRRNGRNGDQRENHRYLGLDENDASRFDEEWNAKAKSVTSKSNRFNSRDWQLRDHGERRAIADYRAEERRN